MQGNWPVCVPLKYLILMPDIREAKCFEFPPTPLELLGGGGKFFFTSRKFVSPPNFFSVTPEFPRTQFLTWISDKGLKCTVVNLTPLGAPRGGGKVYGCESDPSLNKRRITWNYGFSLLKMTRWIEKEKKTLSNET